MSIGIAGIAPVPESARSSAPSPRHVGKLWRRVVAGLIDFIILGIIGRFVAWPFANTLMALGPVAPLVGYFIGMLYFAFPESSIGSGASLGKRFLLLQVVHRDGSLLTVEESLVRYTVFSIPIFLNRAALPLSHTPWGVLILIGIVVFGLGGFTDYLILFNRNTRQGIHDLSVGSFVAEADRSGAVSASRVWRAHWLIAGALLTVLAVAGAVLKIEIREWDPLDQLPLMMENVRLVEQVDGVQSAGVVKNTGYNGRTLALSVTIRCNCEEGAEEAIADKAARELLRGDPHISDYPVINIVVGRGYDIGIASTLTSKRFSDTPDRWSERVLGTPLAPDQQ
jgi:uncharacterized RDD family membrane protein YckC